MNFVKKLMCAAAMALGTTGAAIASPVLNNWVFNPTGTGFSGGQVINEYLDINGNAFIQLNRTGSTSFEFREHAVFNVPQADSDGRYFPISYRGGNITATFEATGSGTFGGAFNFTGGTMRMYHNPTNGQYAGTAGYYGANLGNMIAEFNVMGGGGMVDQNGIPTNNGQVSVFAEAAAGMLDAGYFFNSAGKDLSTDSLLSFAFTNANTLGSPTSRLVSEVACQFSGFTGPGCNGRTYRNRPGEYFFIGSNGQFKLAETPSDVPEPGSIALFGIALAAAGAVARKRKAVSK